MSVSIFEAIDIILKNTTPLSTEILPIEQILLKISAQDIKATIALPQFNNSAMDGYALKGEFKEYKVVGKILAGDSHDYTLKESEAIKIMTGAKAPSNTDKIIPQENTKTVDNSTIQIIKDVAQNAHIRYKGEDIDIDETILSCGEKINSSHIALLASQGITHVEVYKKPRVAIFASGNELKLHFEKLEDSQIYNSNTPYLIARAKELGCEASFIGKSDDSIESLKQIIENSLSYDFIVTSGGVSVGEADFTKEAFNSLECIEKFSKVEIKPGKPTTFGVIGKTLILNLPGNPLASAINFEIFAKPLIEKLSGSLNYHHGYIETKMEEEFIKTRKVPTVIPGFFNGKSFKVADQFSPGMINVLNHCNGFILISKDKNQIKKDDIVKFLPTKWNFTQKDFVDFQS